MNCFRSGTILHYIHIQHYSNDLDIVKQLAVNARVRIGVRVGVSV